LASELAERRLAAILSADVAGYSRLMAADEEGTVRRLAAYREEVALLVRRHRGRLVDFTGDNFLAEFPSALEAVQAAAEIAAAVVDDIRRANPQLRADDLGKSCRVVGPPEAVATMRENLRRAGLP
jgi:class 3 adenylate cyclase